MRTCHIDIKVGPHTSGTILLTFHGHHIPLECDNVFSDFVPKSTTYALWEHQKIGSRWSVTDPSIDYINFSQDLCESFDRSGKALLSKKLARGDITFHWCPKIDEYYPPTFWNVHYNKLIFGTGNSFVLPAKWGVSANRLREYDSIPSI